MTDLSPLIERLTAATGADRELDCLIHLKVGGKVALWHGKMVPEDSAGVEVPHYTGSLDAALTLVPVGYVWECGFSRFVPHNAVVRSMSGALPRWAPTARVTAMRARQPNPSPAASPP